MGRTGRDAARRRCGLLKGAYAMWHNQAILYEADFFLNGDLRELDRLAAEIGRFCAAHSLGDDVAFELNLVLEELFVNTVRHGGCDGMDRSAHVRLCYGPPVEVEFADRGRPFDLTLAEPADIASPLAERNAGGLGIHLVRQIMRDVEYHRVDEWNRVTMKRKEGTI